MGLPVVHFEVVGKDVEQLRSFYSDIAGWEFDTVEGGPTEYSTVAREKNVNADGVGIGGGVGEGPEGYPGHVTFYIEVPDVGASLDRVEDLGGTKVMGPDTRWRASRSGSSTTRKATSSAWSSARDPMRLGAPAADRRAQRA